MSDERIVQLLTEIRDAQREAAAFARSQVEQAEALSRRQLANQEVAVQSQLATAKLYRRVVATAGILLVLAVGLLVALPYF